MALTLADGLAGSLLGQVLGDALLRENYRTRQYERSVENLETIVGQRTATLRELSSNLLRAQDDERRRRWLGSEYDKTAETGHDQRHDCRRGMRRGGDGAENEQDGEQHRQRHRCG